MFKVLKISSLVSFIVLQSQIVLAQAAPAAAQTAEQPPAWMQMVPILAIVVVFYFFMIRPQSKKQKEQVSFLQSLKVGDQIVTAAGILGKITGLNDNIANVEVAAGVQVKLLRSQISMLQSALQKPETPTTKS